MRSGLVGRWAAVTGAVLLTGACTQATGLAGVGATSPTTPPPSAGATPAATAPTPEHMAAEQPPQGGEPVKVPPPKLSKYTYTFPVKGCKTEYQRKLLVLPKTTIWAPQGCAFVAPVGGVVDEVNVQDRWSPSTDAGATREGKFVTIIGDDGVRYLGGHLDSVADGIKPGTRVKGGQVLGKVGRSGNARDAGPNLYFAISWKTGPAFWWVRRGMVKPWDYLDAWQEGNRTLSPREETLKLRGKLGETPQCTVQCGGAVRQQQDPPQASKTPQPQKSPKKDDDDVVTLTPTTAPLDGR
ncbi:peptidase M23 [[Actinomadura] parvosata subsp. kistnae]|uniref:Peptidase M23 n=1 Tax=[Actinomadura] parvosata subsp. kistnae TaxID=1909395 RepID=A0A1V0AKR9_9ACTN|nr:peptidase M23 [Nonomuraea sp. ATCC 55076]